MINLSYRNITKRIKIITALLCSILIISGCSSYNAEITWELEEDTSACEEVLVEKSLVEETQEMIYVYVCGHVRQPDVYSLAAGTRLYEAIEAAGGAADDADLQQLNLADQLTDGQRIYVPAEGETAAESEYTEDKMSNGLVNINTATAEQLQTLPGIGQAKAKAIVAYREANGNFSSIEDLRKVPGIKEGVFGQVQSLICVN